MGSIGRNRTVGQVNQTWDENIKVKEHRGSYPTRENAELQARAVAESPTEDAVVTEENGRYHVYSTNEVGTLDPSANETGNYPIHQADPRVVSFSVTPRGYSGEDLGRAPVTQSVSDSEADVNFPTTRVENGIVHVGRETTDFRENIAGLNSGGDSLRIYAEGEAGVRWGFGAVEFEGGLDLTISKDDDGLYTVARTGRLGVFAASNPDLPVQGEVGVAGQYQSAFRSRDPEEINSYLVDLARNMPGSDTFFPNLEAGRDMSEAGTIRTATGQFQAEIEGEVKLGGVKLEGNGEFTAERRLVSYPNGNHSTDDWSRSWSGSVSLTRERGFGVQFSGNHETYVVNNNPIPENNGRYVKIDGSVELTFSASDAAKFTGGDTAKLSMALIASGEALGLTGDLLNDYVANGESQVLEAISAGGRDIRNAGIASAGDITFGVAAQAQWEVQTEDGTPTGRPDETQEDRLQYFRMGTTSSVSFSGELDLGVAYGELEVGVERTNLADLVVGRTDITYLQGLYFEQPGDYENLKAKVGNRPVQGKTLSQWEQEWQNTNYSRADEAVVNP